MADSVVSRDSRRTLAGLVHQQCWLWGCDIRRREGNVLVAHGVRRLPAPAGVEGSSAYHARVDARTDLALWGFGLALLPADGDALLLERFRPCPATVSDGAQLRRSWHVSHLPTRTHSDAPQSWWRVLTAFDWIAAYEAWVQCTVGPAWRERCLHGWDAAVTSPTHTSQAWAQLAARIRREVMASVVPSRT
jgi:hypothetical protein